MNRLLEFDRPKRALKPIILTLALTLSGAAASAASMDDVVKMRAHQTIDQRYGRDSVDALSPDSTPLLAERTFGSRWLRSQPSADVVSESDPTADTSGIDDETTTQFDRGYYQDPEDVALLEDDGTATRYDRAYYQDPDGLAVRGDDTATRFDRGYYQEPDRVAILAILPDGTQINGEERASVDQ